MKKLLFFVAALVLVASCTSQSTPEVVTSVVDSVATAVDSVSDTIINVIDTVAADSVIL